MTAFRRARLRAWLTVCARFADTEANCTRSGVQTGNTQWASPNCYAYSGGDNGCTVYDYDPTSYGAGFNAAGGGVFALQIAETG